DVDLLGHHAERIVRDPGQLGAEHDPLGRDADLLADRPGDQLTVAGQDLDADTAGLKLDEGVTRGWIRRIEEGDEPGQREIALVGSGQAVLVRRRGLVPYREQVVA